MRRLHHVFTRTSHVLRSVTPIPVIRNFCNYEAPSRLIQGKVAFLGGGSIMKGTGNDIFRTVTLPITASQNTNQNPQFRKLINELFQEYKPSKHPFFAALATAPHSVVTNKKWLNEFYVRYQAAMHSTRTAVYFAPHLNSPALRQRKIAILSDDDTIGDEKSHHQHLENMFRRFGAEPCAADTFGDLKPLAKTLDKETARFVRTANKLYRKSTGAWCIAEVLSDDWLSALANSFKPHFPFVMQEPYFDEIFISHVEIIHMLETVSLTEDILHRYPNMIKPTCEHARLMAKEIDGLWDNLHGLVKNP